MENGKFKKFTGSTADLLKFLKEYQHTQRNQHFKNYKADDLQEQIDEKLRKIGETIAELERNQAFAHLSKQIYIELQMS